MSEVDEFTSLELERLVRRYEVAVRSVALTYDVRSQDLDELFQDVRIRLWKSLGTPERMRTATSGYVRKTARSAVIDQLRRNRRHAADVALSEADGFDAAGPVEEQVDLERLQRVLEHALLDLVPTRRPVVRMHLAGYSRDDIGELLGWSEPKVRNLLYRGLADLREALRRRGVSGDVDGPEPDARETRVRSNGQNMRLPERRTDPPQP